MLYIHMLVHIFALRCIIQPFSTSARMLAAHLYAQKDLIRMQVFLPFIVYINICYMYIKISRTYM